jgi:transposase-like protein
MYSYEDRVRAVKLYIKLGKRTSATIRQLGYLNRQKFELVWRAAGQVQFLAAPNRSFQSTRYWSNAGVDRLELSDCFRSIPLT